MANILFVTWDGGGNVPPAVGIAQALSLRGHHVEFLGYEVQRPHIEAQGLAFQTLRRSGSFDIYRAHEPAERIAGLMAQVWACPEHLDDIPDAVAGSSADVVVVVDFMMQGALAAASRLSVPVAVLAHSLIAGLIPPPDSPMGAARLAATNQLRERVGLITLTRLTAAWAGYLTLVTTLPELDPAAVGADPSVHYVGPVFEQFPVQSWDSPWEADDPRPLVLVSFTTTRLWDQRGRIRNTLDALSGEPVRMLVSAAEPEDFSPLPTNATIRRFVPHALVLPSTSVTVTHAGHGTTAASLAHGVPLVMLPNPVADQPFLAATLQRLGAGLALDGEAGPEAIRTGVLEVLRLPAYATAARRLADAISAMPGVTGAAAELEQLAVSGATSRI